MRLYLLKDAKQDLYTDFPRPLPQHQIDGIRFLYKQFKKKNPGVILNDPPGYEKCLQVVLFLRAIRPLLQKPILVICPKECFVKWREHLLEWAGFSDNDIAVESSNPFAKHSIFFINTIEDVAAFSRRHYSIVVFERNEVYEDTTLTMKILCFALNSEYKIWVTSVDIQANLDKLPAIYHWLNPDDKTNIQDIITTKGSSVKDEVDHLIILDAFLESFVIRRNNFLSPFKTTEIEKSKAEVKLQEDSRRRSRKCKDITGKKVKRSKKRAIEESNEGDTSMGSENNATTNFIEVASTVSVPVVAASRQDDSIEYFNFTNNKNTEVTENNEMDIETFIRDQEPINSVQSNNENDNMSQIEANTSDFVNAVNEIVNNENNNSRDENYSPSLFESVATNEMEVDDSNFEVPISSKQNDSLVSKSNHVLEDVKIEKEIPGTLNGNLKVSANNDVDLTNKKADSLNKTDEKANVKDENSQEINVKNGEASDNVNNNNCKGSTNGHEKVNIKKEETSYNVTQIDDKLSVKKETDSNIVVKKGITDQIADLEKEALNKYKGSILDNLFKF